MRAPPGRLAALSARTPLRVKLVAGVVLLAALGLFVSGGAAAAALRGYLLDRVDGQLVGAARDPDHQLAALAGGASAPGAPGGPGPRGSVFVRLGDDIRNAPGGVPPPRLPASHALDQLPFTVGATDGPTRWRVVETSYAVRLRGGVELMLPLVIAVPLDEVHRTTERLLKIEAVVGGAVLSLLAVGGVLLVRRNLQPLVEVERTAEAIAAGNLALRVPESDPRTEVGRLSLAFNTMLGHIEQAFRAREESEGEAKRSEERMRRFVADASHELRTPLTSIRGFAELYRQGALPERPDVDRAMGRVESEAERMGTLVEDLLLLARLDQQRPLDRSPVDLLQLASDAVLDARATDVARPVELAPGDLRRQPVVLGDEDRLRQVLGNLVTNALVHTPPGTPVVVRVRTTAFDAYVEVCDSGPGIAAADRARVFERFFRADASRTRAHGGSGLGLSIVAALAAAHGGAAELVGTPGGGATFRLRLPLAP